MCKKEKDSSKLKGRNELPFPVRHKLLISTVWHKAIKMEPAVIFIKPVKIDLHEGKGQIEITYEVKDV